MLVWHSHSPKSALKAAQAWLTKLRDEGLVLVRRLPYSGVTHAYVLTRAGADVLTEKYIEQWLADEESEGEAWFAHGYDLSLKAAETRHPVIQLASSMMAKADLVPVGQRGLQRGFLGKRHAKHFDAALLHPDGRVAFGVYLAAGFGTKDQERVRQLAQADHAFLITSTVPKAIEVLTRVRGKARPEMQAYITERLPAGILA